MALPSGNCERSGPEKVVLGGAAPSGLNERCRCSSAGRPSLNDFPLIRLGSGRRQPRKHRSTECPHGALGAQRIPSGDESPARALSTDTPAPSAAPLHGGHPGDAAGSGGMPRRKQHRPQRMQCECTRDDNHQRFRRWSARRRTLLGLEWARRLSRRHGPPRAAARTRRARAAAQGRLARAPYESRRGQTTWVPSRATPSLGLPGNAVDRG